MHVKFVCNSLVTPIHSPYLTSHGGPSSSTRQRVKYTAALPSISIFTFSGGMDPRCKICIFMGKTDPDAPKHKQQVSEQTN